MEGKKYSHKLLVLLLPFLLIGTIAQADISRTHETANTNADWVLMFYQCGENAISRYIGVILNQIRSVGATEDVKIAVIIDKRLANDTKLYYYEGTTPVEQEWPTESDLSDPDTLAMFAERVMNDYPADHYCLEITANKGSGWQGICFDERGDDIMITMPELLNALEIITENGRSKLDVLLIQTCLGGNLEFRYQVRQFCDYFVSYADCGLIGDIPFNEILADVVADPLLTAEQFAITVVDRFTPQQIYDIYQAMGSTDSTKLDNLADSINDLAEFFVENMDLYQNDIQLALEVTRKYGIEFNIDYYIDLEDFLEKLAIDESEFLDIKGSILGYIEEAVIAKVTLEGYPSCGFNFYFPGNKDDYNDALRYNHALPSPYEETLFAVDTQWDEFLKEYLDLSSNTPPDLPTIEGPHKGGPKEEHTYMFSAADPQSDEVSYYIDWGDSTYQMDGPVLSEEKLSIGHTWESEGSYTIKVKAIDQYGAMSNWATLEVTIPKSKTLNHPFLYWFLQRHIQRFPVLRELINSFI